MAKPLIGIVPSGHYLEGKSVYDDAYSVVNAYGKSIYAAGGIPLGLVPEDAHLGEEALSVCDAILIAGGLRILPYHLEAVEHALKTGKRLLGVCLGMQAIHAYFLASKEKERRGFTGPVTEMFAVLKAEKRMFVLPVGGHWEKHMNRENLEDVLHEVTVLEGTMLSRVLGKTKIPAPTMHHYAVNMPEELLTVSAFAADGVIEGLEAAPNIIGVQFHPEIDPSLMPLFKWLCR